MQNIKDFLYVLQTAQESGETVFNYNLFRIDEVKDYMEE